jgi:hypothetical protein
MVNNNYDKYDSDGKYILRGKSRRDFKEFMDELHKIYLSSKKSARIIQISDIPLENSNFRGFNARVYERREWMS